MSVPAYGRGLELDEFEGPFQPKSLYDAILISFSIRADVMKSESEDWNR